MKNIRILLAGLAFFSLILLGDLGAQVNTVLLQRSDKWRGFDREVYSFNGYQAWYVKPAKALEGNPWIWKAYFPDWHVAIDSILLSRGFHMVYFLVPDMFGAPLAMGQWDKFYTWVIREKKLAGKVALEGVSRGGLYVYNWAKRNPSKVTCIYCEGPVCDIRSWPGGKGKTKGDPKEWDKCLKAYGFDNEQAMAYDDNPIDNLRALAMWKVPVYHAIGLKDSIVPNEENTFKLVDRYIRQGGIATVVPMTRSEQTLQGHHYDIEDPGKIADFVITHSYPVRKVLDPADYHQLRGGLGNCYLKFLMQKKGRVVFMGGSITWMNGWRNSVCRYLSERFPETEFEFINAGISSTGSTPGAFRLAVDALAKGEVDLLFEEAAVNDRTNGFTSTACIRGMEGIVRHARKVNPLMDIVLMYFADPDKTGDYNQGKVPYEISAHDAVAQHYNIPSINLAKEINDRINHGEFTWKFDFIQLHPSPFGCELYFQSIKTLLEKCWTDIDLSAQRKPYPLPRILDRFSYANGNYVDVKKAVPGKGWKLMENWKPEDKLETREGYVNVPVLESVKPGSVCTFTFTGTAVGICVASGPDAGIVEYSIDGKPFRKADLFTRWSKNLHLPWYVMLDDELKASGHVLKLSISEEKNEKSSGNACRIIHFLVNQKEGK